MLTLRASIYDAIMAECEVAALQPEAVAAVAVVESRLNPGAIGDDGHSLGMWQLHDEGAGAGMTDDERIGILSSTHAAVQFLAMLMVNTGNHRDMWSAYNQGLSGWRKRGGRGNPEYVAAVQRAYDGLVESGLDRVEVSARWATWS